MPDPAQHWFQVGRTGVANAAVSVGIAAMDTDRERAADLFNWALSLGHPDAGMLLEQIIALNAADLPGAATEPPDTAESLMERYRDAIPEAALELGVRLAGQGAMAAVLRIFEEMAASGNPELAHGSWIALGNLLSGTGDVPGARRAYEQGRCGHAEHSTRRLHRCTFPYRAIATGPGLADIDRRTRFLAANRAGDQRLRAAGHPSLCPGRCLQHLCGCQANPHASRQWPCDFHN